MATIDFSAVTGIEPLPADKYIATVVEATEGQSGKGNTKIDLKWKVVGGKYDGRMIFDVLTFTPQTAFRVKNTLMGLGFPRDFKGEVRVAELIGKNASITVDIQASTQVDPDSGEPYPPRNRVKKVAAIKTAPAAKK